MHIHDTSSLWAINETILCGRTDVPSYCLWQTGHICSTSRVVAPYVMPRYEAGRIVGSWYILFPIICKIVYGWTQRAMFNSNISLYSKTLHKHTQSIQTTGRTNQKIICSYILTVYPAYKGVQQTFIYMKWTNYHLSPFVNKNTRYNETLYNLYICLIEHFFVLSNK